MACLVGLDVGTTGVKALVVDPASGAAYRCFREYGIDSDGAGKAEQDAEHVWRLAKTVLAEAIRDAGTPKVAALSLSVQGDAIIPVDGNGDALGPAILGMDYRCQSVLQDIEKRFAGLELFHRTGMRPHPLNSFVKMLWLRRERRDIFGKAATVATYSDFIMGKMGCPGIVDQCMASRSMAYNLSGSAWDNAVLDAFDFPARLLPKVVPSGSAVGGMSRTLASELGLAEAPLVVAGGHDQAVAAVGSGAITPEVAVASTGTAEVLSRFLDKPILSDGMYESSYPCYCSAMGEGYFTFSLNHVGGLALRWFRDKWCSDEMREAEKSGRDAYDLIVDEMPREPSDILFMPHFTGSGTPYNNFDTKASVVGMTLATDRPSVGLGLLEGLTFELRTNLERMRELGMETTRVRNVGGGSRSKRWLQLKADILNVPVEVMANSDAACLGAVILAGTAAGVFSSVADGVKCLVKTAGAYEPDPGRAGMYAERYARYSRLYAALAAFYTGAP